MTWIRAWLTCSGCLVEWRFRLQSYQIANWEFDARSKAFAFRTRYQYIHVSSEPASMPATVLKAKALLLAPLAIS